MESWPTNQDRCFGWFWRGDWLVAPSCLCGRKRLLCGMQTRCLDQPWVGASQIGKEKTIAAWYVS